MLHVLFPRAGWPQVWFCNWLTRKACEKCRLLSPRPHQSLTGMGSWICISDRPVRWCVCAPDFENLCSRVFHLKEHGVNLSLKGFIQGLMWTLPLLSRKMVLIFFLYPLGPRQELCNSSAPLYAVKSQVFIPGFMPGRQLHHLNIFLNSYVIN